MLQFAEVLMKFGMDFQYEHNGSNGEEIISYELGIKIQNKEGKLHYEFEGENSKWDVSDSSMKSIKNLIHNECINATSSF